MIEILNTDRIIQSARNAVDKMKESRLRVALTGATTKTPTLVQRIDREDSYYYIVTLGVGTRDTARIIVDAFDASTHEIAGVTEENASLPRMLETRDAMDRLFIVANECKPKWETPMRRGLVGLHPVLVWKPCQQSSSPFMPFHQFSIGTGFVYLRIDGRLSAGLTTGPA